jgi:3-oxoacyl-[acyl-carrier protein] reductase
VNAIDLKGKVAVVTGGASGIGYAIACRFQASGARVALWDLKNAASAAAGLPDAVGITVDVSDEASVSQALEETKNGLGEPDILVTSAGITGLTAPVNGHPLADWRKVIDVHVLGAFLCCRAVLPGMIARDYGRIVTVASVAGKEGNVNSSSYSAAKAGVIGFTKSLGKELAATGVRANCIAPGLIDTPLMEQLPEAQIAMSLSKIPMGRFGTVEEVGALVAWMCSAECSFNAGAVFDLSGGRATY